MVTPLSRRRGDSRTIRCHLGLACLWGALQGDGKSPKFTAIKGFADTRALYIWPGYRTPPTGSTMQLGVRSA